MKKTDDLKQKPWEFFNAFRPFLGKSKGSDTIILETEENAAETDESIISYKVAQYFTNIASTIGENHVLDLSEEDHKNHTSIKAIRKEQLDIDSEFQPITEHDLKGELKPTLREFYINDYITWSMLVGINLTHAKHFY
ncbi:hypothetical protein P5673_023252 [Acropora cervicornis]|uniref:Uncharacterized protein n=1 Tax=Acropora cervicornis TaxID=6130 RepID=A0AAD9Q610_ACRCE|nr:hypothetical protein P5673_023252 [Acropora cervicornis]